MWLAELKELEKLLSERPEELVHSLQWRTGETPTQSDEMSPRARGHF